VCIAPDLEFGHQLLGIETGPWVHAAEMLALGRTIAVLPKPRSNERMSARVVVSKGRTGKFRVALETAQGRMLLSSDQFEDKRTAAGLVRSLKGVLPSNTVFEDKSAGGNGTSQARPKR
jgi:uncharacterized protein YegP (UPF0339 family)